MAKVFHEIRDPIHTFIKISTEERRVLDSRPFQRLRHIHQLAMAYLLYPGATHKRFEHSLGVMELAGRVFDIITRPENVCDEVRNLLPQITDPTQKTYWKEVLRMAALCHDMGHLPFSHAAEKDLLPENWNHERLTVEIIRSEEMMNIWNKITPPLRCDDIVKVAVGEKDLKKFEKDIEFSLWEKILSEIIIGDVFGVDRIDYLLRDSHHTGVAYGKFDHYRLLDTLRILPSPEYSLDKGNGKEECEEEYSKEPALGIEEGGLHSAESLLLARYFMFTQVYLHPIRRIYDMHLKEFLMKCLPEGKFSNKIELLLKMTDNEILVNLLKSAVDKKCPGHDSARRIIQREHFKRLYQRNPEDQKVEPFASQAIFEAVSKKFGKDSVRLDIYQKESTPPPFPLKMFDGRIVWANDESGVLDKIPPAVADYVFIDPVYIEKASKWLDENRSEIITNYKIKEEGV